MELKKSQEASNDRLRYPMIFVGILFAGSLVLASFTYSAPKELKAAAEVLVQTDDQTMEVQDKPEEQKETPQTETVDATPPPQEVIIEEKTEEKAPPKDVAPPPPPVIISTVTKTEIEVEIVEFPDVEASFVGGAAAMKKWIQENVVYPEISRELGDQGRVYVSFVVEQDGTITGIDIPRSLTTELDREAKRLVREMPKWTPGSVKGENVRSRCRLPITFTLAN